MHTTAKVCAYFLILGCAATSQAALINVSHDFALDPAALPGPTFETSVDVPRFDPALGTLETVVLEFTGQFGGSLTVSNTSTHTVTVRGTLAWDLSLLSPPTGETGTGSVLLDLQAAVSRQARLDPFDPEHPEWSQVWWGPLAASDSASTSFPLRTGSIPVTGDISMFIGTGMLTLPVSASFSATAVVISPANVEVTAEGTATVAGQGRVTYTYSAIPEPLALTMLSVCVAALRRR